MDEGSEHPSHLNVEGQNAQHTSAAGEALSGGSSRSESGAGNEKTGNGSGRPVMEKYAYHSMSPYHVLFHMMGTAKPDSETGVELS